MKAYQRGIELNAIQINEHTTKGEVLAVFPNVSVVTNEYTDKYEDRVYAVTVPSVGDDAWRTVYCWEDFYLVAIPGDWPLALTPSQFNALFVVALHGSRDLLPSTRLRSIPTDCESHDVWNTTCYCGECDPGPVAGGDISNEQNRATEVAAPDSALWNPAQLQDAINLLLFQSRMVWERAAMPHMHVIGGAA